MRTLRTPDERFVGLPDFDFEPHYVDVADPDRSDGRGAGALRMHYLDEGPPDGDVVLLMHGEPSWSYLYRRMIPVLVGAGHRCVAPDLVGFGRSDKPAERHDHTYARHVEWMREALLERLDLSDLTLVGHDWGGMLGLRLVADHPDRFARVVAANTGLPTGDQPVSGAFMAWQRFSQETPDFNVGGIIDGGTTADLSPEVLAAYDAPFPDDTFKAGPRQFPLLVPIAPDDPEAPAIRVAWKALARFDKPFLTAFSDEDAITRGGEQIFQDRVPGAAGQPHATIVGGGHFLQERTGPDLARVVVDFIAATRAAA